MSLPDDRFCPVCGKDAPERYCPRDGTATVLRKRLDAGALDYQPGHVVDGRYRITGRLGRGGFGAVFSANHTGTGQDVALKVLHVDLSCDNAATVRRFWQEAQITARLRHANTVRVFDVGQTEEGAFYLAMEQLHGETLADALETRARQGRTMPEREAADLAIQVCKSLQEAHRAGLVHRDLKPANIMLCAAEDEPSLLVKVLDFGIARTADSSLTGQGNALGTPAYMSPEQCRGLAVDARSDLYSLGVMLFRCVAGRVPFVDENPLTVMFHHAETPAPDPRSVTPMLLSDGFAQCVLRALAKRPDDRFADARAMREALEALDTAEQAQTQWVPPLGEAPTEDFTANIPPRTAVIGAMPVPVQRSSRLIGVAGIAVAVLGLAALTVFALQSPQVAAPIAPVAAPPPAVQEGGPETGPYIPAVAPPAIALPTPVSAPVPEPPKAVIAPTVEQVPKQPVRGAPVARRPTPSAPSPAVTPPTRANVTRPAEVPAPPVERPAPEVRKPTVVKPIEKPTALD